MSQRAVPLRVIACAVLLFGFPIVPAQAADEVPQEALDQALVMLSRSVRSARSSAELHQSALSVFEDADLDGGGLSESDNELRSLIAAAKARAEEFTRLFRHDLDGDGALTLDELRRALLPTARKPLRSSAGQVPPTADQIADTLDRLVADTKLTERDSNGDGRLTVEEALASADPASVAQFPPRFKFGAEFDLDADGTITLEEFSAVLDAAIAMIDADGDQVISDAEVVEVHKTVREIREREQARQFREMQQKQMQTRVDACPIPMVPDDAQLVYLGLGTAPNISNITFDAPINVTFRLDVTIDPGEEPIYLLTTSRVPMMLRFSGSVQRLVQVVNLGKIPMGFAGLDRAQAGWLDQESCMIAGWYPNMANRGLRDERAYVETLAGRPIDKLIGISGMWKVAVPSGNATEKAPSPEPWERREGISGPVWKNAPDNEPDVFEWVDIEAVVARQPVHRYKYIGSAAVFVPNPLESALGRR